MYIIFNSDKDLSPERHLFPSVNAALSISHSVSTQGFLRFNEAIYKTLTNVTVRRQVQTEVVRKFTGSTGLGIYPSDAVVSDCVELDCIGWGGGKFY